MFCHYLDILCAHDLNLSFYVMLKKPVKTNKPKNLKSKKIKELKKYEKDKYIIK